MLSLWLAAAVATPLQLPPVDQCPADAGFVEFRAALTRASAEQDVEAFIALMDDRVRLSFGGRAGKDGFRAMWLQDERMRSRFWAELADVLRLGCAPRQGDRVFPAMFV